MWLNDSEELLDQFNISKNQSLMFQCTGEHLIPHSKGGSAKSENIVAACRFCNQGRHKSKVALSPEKFRKYVLARLARKRWNYNMIPR